MAAGGALGVGALLMRVSDPCGPRWGNSCLPKARNRAALTMALPGLAMVTGGVAALIVGSRRRRKLALSVVLRERRLTVTGRF